MSDVTHILNAMQQGDPVAAEQLLPLVYEELRNLAAQKLAQEAPGQTFQPTALVHEAYLRLVNSAKSSELLGDEEAVQWVSRRHFFAATAEAMRRILIEAARRKGRLKNRADGVRLEFNENDFKAPERAAHLIALDEALDKLGETNPQAGELVKLRYFAGFTNVEAAKLLGISPRKAQQVWAYARAWLQEELSDGDRS
jgi:RNA polymerase sigma factor (TIGR02999 family)